MPVKHDNLFRRIAGFLPLRTAALRAVRGKRKKPGAAAFMANLERELLALERELIGGTYRPGRYVRFEVFDPKHRIVSAAPFRDRVVHHALCAVVEPLCSRSFIANSFANQIGKGSHRAVQVYERYRDRYAHVLRCDIHRYFPAVDHEVLKSSFRRHIRCSQTLSLMDALVDGSNRQEPVNLYFAGDDLFGPFGRRRGLPIGNLTSQFFANLYLNPLDHFVTEVLSASYVRYMDDFALFHDDRSVLEEWWGRIGGFLEHPRLRLHEQKTFIAATAAPAVFLGFELSAGGRRRLPDANVRRFRNRLRSLRDRWRARTVAEDEVRRRVGAWVAHARHADTYRLRCAIFEGGWFDPSSEPGRPPEPAGSSRRFLEQQSEKPPRRLSQQERHRESEQQQRLPSRQHASMPEPGRSRSLRARRGCVQG
ncbi:MAG TPA: RNA-directed DNA polymerase [Caulobacteraceae bacterium]